jgi:hypothetical protein
MKTIHTLLIAGAAFLPALGIAQNDRQPKTQESRTEVKVIISADDNGKKEHKEMKMIVLNDSLITINCEELGKKLKTVDINMPESNGQMDIVIREDGKAPQHISLDLEKMGKELEQVTKQGKALSEDEINRIIERYLPDIEDMNVLIDKQMQAGRYGEDHDRNRRNGDGYRAERGLCFGRRKDREADGTCACDRKCFRSHR